MYPAENLVSGQNHTSLLMTPFRVPTFKNLLYQGILPLCQDMSHVTATGHILERAKHIYSVTQTSCMYIPNTLNSRSIEQTPIVVIPSVPDCPP